MSCSTNSPEFIAKDMNPFPPWYYNEFQQIGTDFERINQVEQYDRKQTSSSIAAEQALIAQLGITANDTVIDLGCGTGTFAVQAAIAGAYVYGIDISQTMLNYARQKAEKAGVLDRVEFHHNGFLRYEHQATPVDFIVTKFALHHLPDFWKMVALLRITAMLNDHGIFYLQDIAFSFPANDYQPRIEQWIQRVSKPLGEGWTAADFATDVREEYTTFGWILEEMLNQAGLMIETAEYPTLESAKYTYRKQPNFQTKQTKLHV